MKRFLSFLTALLVSATSGSSQAGDAWIILFDGKDLSEWHAYGTGAQPDWIVENGLLSTKPKGRDLATNRMFTDFELVFEWRVSPGGNSGVMFRVEELPTESGTRSGPEYQLLDDSRHRDGKNPHTSTGALYALYAPAQPATKPAGEWNESRMRVQGARVQFWLNGMLTVDATIGSAEWTTRIAASKFATAPRYGRSASGCLVLQDHGDKVWFKRILVRPL